MAFFKTVPLLLKRLFKTEVILNNVLKENIPHSQIADKYLEKIRNEVIEGVRLMEFPIKTFAKINKKDMETIITGTYNFVKEKEAPKTLNFYSNLLDGYSSYNIEFDVEGVFQEMIKNKVPFNQNICNKIIYYHSKRGEVKQLENLLDFMKSEGIPCTNKDKFHIVSCYIIAGQAEKAEIFINENKLKTDSHNLFYSRCHGYAVIGDVASLKNILAEMKEQNVTFSTIRIFKLYECLIFGNVDKSVLIELIYLTKDSLVKEYVRQNLHSLILSLNNNYYFNESLIILDNLADFIENSFSIIELFGTSQCPANTFTQVLTLLLPHCHYVSFKKCVFGDIDFDKVYDICQKFSQDKYWKVIHCSLLNKAINEKSLSFIEKSIKFTLMHQSWRDVNLVLYNVFLPSMLESQMVSDYDEIVELFPIFRNNILPVILMKYLCSGDFDNYNSMLLKHNVTRFHHLQFYSMYLLREIRNSLTLGEVGRWAIEARKCFSRQIVNSILCDLFMEEVIRCSKKDSTYSLEEIISFLKEWNIELSPSNIDILLQSAPNFTERIKSLIASRNDFIEEASA